MFCFAGREEITTDLHTTRVSFDGGSFQPACRTRFARGNRWSALQTPSVKRTGACVGDFLSIQSLKFPENKYIYKSELLENHTMSLQSLILVRKYKKTVERLKILKISGSIFFQTHSLIPQCFDFVPNLSGGLYETLTGWGWSL